MLALVHNGPRRAIGAELVCGEERWRIDALKSWAGEAVPAVMFEDVDGDGYQEAIVLAVWVSGMGPDGMEPFQSNAVLDWNGTELVQLPEVEARIEALATAAEIRAALR